MCVCVCIPLKEAVDTGPWVTLQLFGQLHNVLHHNGLVGHSLHQGCLLQDKDGWCDHVKEGGREGGRKGRREEGEEGGRGGGRKGRREVDYCKAHQHNHTLWSLNPQL